MKNDIALTLVSIVVSYACTLRAGAQGFEHLPDHNLFPPGSAQNPIYVQPAYTPPVIQPLVVQPAPQINLQPREREYVPVYPRQERLAPRAEFEMTRFIPVEPYVYSLVKGDMTFPQKGFSKGKSRFVIGKTKQLRTQDRSEDEANAREMHAMMTRYQADEIIFRAGRRWSDGEEILIKFVVWHRPNSDSVSRNSETPSSASQPMPSPPSMTYRVVNVEADDYLSLRRGPGSDYDVIRKLQSGTGGIELKEKRVANGETVWQEISIAGQSGYVNETYLEGERH